MAVRDKENNSTTQPSPQPSPQQVVTMADRHIHAALKYLAAAREQLAEAQAQVIELEQRLERVTCEQAKASPAPLAISVPQAAEALGVSNGVMFPLLKSGELKSIKIGGRRIIPVKALDEFLARRLEDARF